MRQKRLYMKANIYLVLLAFNLSACAAVYTDASDANHVTFLNSSGESIAQLTIKASAYCEQYGKVASFRNSDTQLVAVFDCKAPQAKSK
jgi:putative hemolysin